jgi:enoyl-CoA hydratase/carnithine racemase
VSILGIADAVAQLASPDATERFSPVAGEPLLTVDLGLEGRNVSADALDAARAALHSVPAPTLGLCSDNPSPAGRALLDHFDVLVDAPDELALLSDRIRAQPYAAAGLVQLLRHSEKRDIEAGLIAESLVYSVLQSGPEFGAWLAARGAPKEREGPARSPVRVWRELDCLHIELNRPEKRNAFSVAMRDALCEALQLACADSGLDEIVLEGAGPAFCTGGDLDEFGSLPDPATAHAIRTSRSAARLMSRCAMRTRAELHGACIGAGIELPAFAARVIAAEDTVAALPELSMGLVPGAGGTVSVARRIGRERTAWWVLSGSQVDAETGRDWGLFDEVCPVRRD